MRYAANVCIFVLVCFMNVARADVPPPAARCAAEGAACSGYTIGLLGFEYKGTCMQDVRGFWYCKEGTMCYSAKGPGNVPSPGYGEQPCNELTFANAAATPSASAVASAAPPVESKPAPPAPKSANSCGISDASRSEANAMVWVLAAFIAARGVRRRAKRAI
ncbi:MAG: hypothetical protein IPM54_12605 [Polyangiaceae bacterium]|nr:hypothetical protein [Polyangiaceae bacterium]